MPAEVGFIDGDLLDSDGTAVRFVRDDAIDEKERITMWEDVHDLLDVIDCFPIGGRSRQRFNGSGR